MQSKFNISEVVSKSWKCTISQIWILAGLLIGYSIIGTLLPLLTGGGQSIVVVIVVNVISLILSLIFSLGYLKNIFQTLDDIEPQFSAYGQQARKIFTYFVSSLIYGLIVFVGIILLVIPGIYMALRLQFYTAFIIEEDAGIIESLKRSWTITEGQSLPLFLLFLTMFGIVILGIILFIVGIFIAIPLIYMMYAYVFRKLNSPLQIIEE